MPTVVIRDAMAKAFREVAAGQRQDSREQVERTTRTLRVGANGEVQLDNIAGDIVITRGSGNDVAVEIVKTARGRDDADAREMLQLVQVDITERSGRAEVRAHYPDGEERRRNNRRNVNVLGRLQRHRPGRHRAFARASISGSITARDFKGELSAESVSGTVRITNGGRIASAKSISGNVEVIDTDIDGELQASSASGSVLLRRVKARQLDARLDQRQRRARGRRVPGRSKRSRSAAMCGSPARSAKGGRYELNSHSGSVTAALGGVDRLRARGHLLQRRGPLRLPAHARPTTSPADGARSAASTATAARSSTSPPSPAASSSRSASSLVGNPGACVLGRGTEPVSQCRQPRLSAGTLLAVRSFASLAAIRAYNAEMVPARQMLRRLWL